MNCPECDAWMNAEKCRGCGWTKPTQVIRQGAVWEAPPPLPPPTPEELAEVKRLIAETSAMLGVAQAERPAKLYQTKLRCSACEVGRFVHAGVRYCGPCYGKL